MYMNSSEWPEEELSFHGTNEIRKESPGVNLGVTPQALQPSMPEQVWKI